MTSLYKSMCKSMCYSKVASHWHLFQPPIKLRTRQPAVERTVQNVRTQPNISISNTNCEINQVVVLAWCWSISISCNKTCRPVNHFSSSLISYDPLSALVSNLLISDSRFVVEIAWIEVICVVWISTFTSISKLPCMVEEEEENNNSLLTIRCRATLVFSNILAISQ